MSEAIEESAREQAKKYLPKLIQSVLKSYHDFLMTEDAEHNEEPQNEKEKRTRDKKFTDYHNAGKVAVGHLDLLFKFAKSIGIDTGDSERQMLVLLAHAKEETDRFHEQEGSLDDENDS